MVTAATTAKIPMQIAIDEPEDEVDPLAFLRLLVGQPGDQSATAVATAADEQTDRDDPDNCSPAHRDRAYSTLRRDAVVSDGLSAGRRWRNKEVQWDSEQVCF